MTPDDARALIERGIPGPGGVWADLGAGTGTFTLALAGIIGSSGIVYAVERDRDALKSLRGIAAGRSHDTARVEVVAADFTRELPLPKLAGILAANALHFVAPAEQRPLLERLAGLLDPGGRFLIVEYDRERGNPWVPHPISRARLARLAREATLEEPTFIASAPSAYGGDIYAAVLGPLPSHRSAPVRGK